MELISGQRVDQVPRMERFRAEHPDIEIVSPLVLRSAFWKARRGGEVLAIELDLRRLLDTLDRRLEGEQ